MFRFGRWGSGSGSVGTAAIASFAVPAAGAQAGDTVATQGIGGLGHLGIQYARQMGFHTIAIGRGGDKAELAKKLGCAWASGTAKDSEETMEFSARFGVRPMIEEYPFEKSHPSV